MRAGSGVYPEMLLFPIECETMKGRVDGRAERKSGCGFAAHSQVVLSLCGPNFAGSRGHTFFIMLYHIPKENFYHQSARIDLKYRYHYDILCVVESESSR